MKKTYHVRLNLLQFSHIQKIQCKKIQYDNIQYTKKICGLTRNIVASYMVYRNKKNQYGGDLHFSIARKITFTKTFVRHSQCKLVCLVLVQFISYFFSLLLFKWSCSCSFDYYFLFYRFFFSIFFLDFE